MQEGQGAVPGEHSRSLVVDLGPVVVEEGMLSAGIDLRLQLLAVLLHCPLQRLSLSPGRHKIRLVSPPTGHELTFSVQISPDSEITRIADLRDAPHLIEGDPLK